MVHIICILSVGILTTCLSTIISALSVGHSLNTNIFIFIHLLFVVGKDRGTTPLLLRNWWLTPKIRQTENCPFYSQQTPFLYHQMWNVNIPLWQLESNCYREVFVLCRCLREGGNSGSSCDTCASTYSTGSLRRLVPHLNIQTRFTCLHVLLL